MKGYRFTEAKDAAERKAGLTAMEQVPQELRDLWPINEVEDRARLMTVARDAHRAFMAEHKATPKADRPEEPIEVRALAAWRACSCPIPDTTKRGDGKPGTRGTRGENRIAEGARFVRNGKPVSDHWNGLSFMAFHYSHGLVGDGTKMGVNDFRMYLIEKMGVENPLVPTWVVKLPNGVELALVNDGDTETLAALKPAEKPAKEPKAAKSKKAKAEAKPKPLEPTVEIYKAVMAALKDGEHYTEAEFEAATAYARRAGRKRPSRPEVDAA